MAYKDREVRLAYNRAYRAKNKPWLDENAKIRGKVWYQKAKNTDPKALLLRSAQSRASAKNIKCTVAKTDFEIPLVCPLLGIWMSPASGKAQASSPSLDRIDSSKGYVPGNVWVISHKANAMKNNASQDELTTFARNILKLF